MSSPPVASPLKSPNVSRVNCVDAMRALALIGMVLCHYPIYLSSGTGSDEFIYFLGNHVFGDFPASWFVFLVGVSVVLSSHNRKSSAHDFARLFVRGGVLFVMGLMFLFFIQGPGNLWNWDILTFIAVATVVLGLCRGWPSWLLVVLAVAVLLITPWVRSFTPIAPFYGGQFLPVQWIDQFFPNILFDPVSEYQATNNPLEIVTGFFIVGEFPILPWLFFPILGMVVGRRLVAGKIPRDLPVLLGLGLLFIVFGLGKAYWSSSLPAFDVATDWLAPLSFYPLSTSMSILQLGVLLVLFAILWFLFDGRELQSKAMRGMMRYFHQISKYSLTIYITHFAAFFIPLRLIAEFTGEDHLRNLTSSETAMGVGILLMIAYYPVLRLWDRAGGLLSFEWTLNALVNLILHRPTNKPRQPTG